MRRLSVVCTVLTFLLFTLSSFAISKNDPTLPKVTKSDIKKLGLEINAKITYLNLKLKNNDLSLPKMETFTKALAGFYELKEKGLIKKNILTLIDFTMSSTTKRLWVIDLENNTVLYNSLVAHGKNSGEEFATSFSNENSSNKSSLGFYTTGETYNGKHGLSLKLDGQDKGLNTNARMRSVVVHSADYVSESFIKIHKRLGRSQGCPALPKEITKEIISLIKNKSCLFIYHSSYDSKNS